MAEVARIVDGVAVKVADRTAAERLTNTSFIVDAVACRRPKRTSSISPTWSG